MNNRSLNIAILGSRGIPAEFGGFETFAERLSIRLVEKGLSVTVFCESTQKYQKSSYKGVQLEFIRTPHIAGIRSIWFDIISIIKSLRKYDIIYMLGYHSAFFYFIPRLFGDNFWVNMDGIEWKRDKWSGPEKLFIWLMEYLAIKWSSVLVADADGMVAHLYERGAIKDKVVMIPYGADEIQEPNKEYLSAFNLSQDGYYLVVCRLEPENHVLEIVRGFHHSASDKQLVIVGDHEAGTAYIQRILDIKDKRVRFIGTIYNKPQLESLRYYCYAYLHGHSVGGTNPSLLEAMAAGNLVIAHDNTFNREVTGNKAFYFHDASQLANIINKIEEDRPPEIISSYYKNLVLEKYNWDVIANAYYLELQRRMADS